MEPRSSKPRPTPDRTVVRPVPDEPLTDADRFLSPPRQPGEVGRLGPYRVLGVLGRGGMGAVYRAEDPRLNRQVAVKVLLPGLSGDANAKARFRREAHAQAKVDHDNIIHIYEVEEANGVAYIAMPLLKGQTLSAALRQSPRPPLVELVRIGREIAEGLEAAHGAGLIHRDIKPGNIWLEEPKRRVKILDFGLARNAGGTDDLPAAHAAGAAFPAENDRTEQLTARGAVMGTPAYMSPEQARGEPLDRRSDIFSLGVLLYQTATGRKPFNGTSAFDIMAAVATQEPHRAGAVVPDLPPALDSLVGRMLAKDPARRPQNGAEVVAELDAIADGLVVLPVVVMPLGPVPGEPNPWEDLDTTHAETETTDAESPRPEQAKARPPLPKWLWPVVGGLGLIAVLALVSFAVPWWKPKPQPPVEETKTGTPVVVQPKPEVPKKDSSQRTAAEWILKQKGGRNTTHVHVQQAGAAKAEQVFEAANLPAGPFTVTGLCLDYLNAADEPKLAEAFGPLGDLSTLTFNGPAWADDRLAAALGALKGKSVGTLKIQNFDQPLTKAAVALRGLASVGALELSTPAAGFIPLKELGAVPVKKELALHVGLTDDALAPFADMKGWPQTFNLRGNANLTDAGIAHIRPNPARVNVAIEIHPGGRLEARA